MEGHSNHHGRHGSGKERREDDSNRRSRSKEGRHSKEKLRSSSERHHHHDSYGHSSRPHTHRSKEKSKEHGSKDDHDSAVFPKPPYIPIDIATSTEDKFKRIERWRKEGADYLLQQQKTDESQKMNYNEQHAARRHNADVSPPRELSKERRRHSSHDGRVESNGNSRPVSKPGLQNATEEDVEAAQRILAFIAKSLNGDTGVKSPLTKPASDTLQSPPINSIVAATPKTSVKFKRSSPAGNENPSELRKPIKPESHGKLETEKSKGGSLSKARSTPTPTAPASSRKSDLKKEKPSTLKIANLPLSITLNDLKSLFPQSTVVTIPMKQFGGESDISLGQAATNPTAMVKFRSRSDANEVIEHFQGLKIRGNTLKISFEHQLE